MFVVEGKLDGDELRQACEKNYNNRAMVPEHPEIIGKWLEDAAAYREAAQADFDIPYLEQGLGGSERTRLDIFWPKDADRDSCPMAMFIHGGYWQGQDRKSLSHLARGAVERGVAVAMPSYDLCPDVTIGTITQQMAAACLYLWRTYKRRLAVSGHSAGGHLTAAMFITDFSSVDDSAPRQLVPAAMPISGIFDLRDLTFMSVNDKAGMSMEEAEAWSPLLAPAPTSGVVHAVVGGAESPAFHWQSRTLADEWGKAGVQTSYEAPDGENHFTVVLPLADPASDLAARFAELARQASERK